MHMLNWIQKQAKAVTEQKAQLASHRFDLLDARRTTVQKMVCGMAAKIAGEYEQLLEDAAYATTWGKVWEFAPDDDLERMRSQCVYFVLEGACDFHHRVAKSCTSLPLILVWVVHSAPEVRCETRVEVARQLLSLLDDDTQDPRTGPCTNPYKLA